MRTPTRAKRATAPCGSERSRFPCCLRLARGESGGRRRHADTIRGIATAAMLTRLETRLAARPLPRSSVAPRPAPRVGGARVAPRCAPRPPAYPRQQPHREAAVRLRAAGVQGSAEGLLGRCSIPLLRRPAPCLRRRVLPAMRLEFNGPDEELVSVPSSPTDKPVRQKLVPGHRPRSAMKQPRSAPGGGARLVIGKTRRQSARALQRPGQWGRTRPTRTGCQSRANARERHCSFTRACGDPRRTTKWAGRTRTTHPQLSRANMRASRAPTLSAWIQHSGSTASALPK